MTNIVADERINLRVPFGTTAKLIQMAKKHKIKNISEVIRKLIEKGLQHGL